MFTASHRAGEGPPLLLLHGFTDTWRAWELTLPALERHHEVLAPTLPGHAGGPPLLPDPTAAQLVDAVERAMDQAGWETAHIAGNSLGGYVALALAQRGRARSVVALAPAGGWAAGDESFRETLQRFLANQPLQRAAAPHAEAILATAEGRRRATLLITESYAHIPAELLAHAVLAAASCAAVGPLIEVALREGWPLRPELVDCPVRFVWGLADRILPFPSAAERYRSWFPTADWVELDGVGHCQQLDVPLITADLILSFTS